MTRPMPTPFRVTQTLTITDVHEDKIPMVNASLTLTFTAVSVQEAVRTTEVIERVLRDQTGSAHVPALTPMDDDEPDFE